jgi:hypothetical protein
MSDKLCNVCTAEENIADNNLIKVMDFNFYNYLKVFKLIPICKECVAISRTLYLSDFSRFLEWLDENDNREDPTTDAIIKELRNELHLDLSEDLMVNDLNEYVENLHKYIIVLENEIITLTSSRVDYAG